jgi:hypothetical protein
MLRRLLLAAGWLLPMLLAALFFIKGRHYDPSVFVPPAGDTSSLPVPVQVDGWLLEGAEPLPADRMFEKINGKAAYYLQYDATGLCTGEWVADGQRWDMYLYRFEEAQGARGAYNGERPSDGIAVAGAEGYTVPGQAALSVGPFYLQLNAQTAQADPAPAVELALALASHLGNVSSGGEVEAEMDLIQLAGENLVGDAEGFLPENAFGFSALHKVRTIRVALNGAEAEWFTAPGDEATVKTYAGELAMYGGENLFNQDNGSGGAMFGTWEFAGILNGSVWGVHAAPSHEALLLHWETLKERVGEQ